jgi:hypothetical protein
MAVVESSCKGCPRFWQGETHVFAPRIKVQVVCFVRRAMLALPREIRSRFALPQESAGALTALMNRICPPHHNVIPQNEVICQCFAASTGGRK